MSKVNCGELGEYTTPKECECSWFAQKINKKPCFAEKAKSAKQTVFHQITQSPEVLAPVFVGMMYNRICGNYLNYSMLTGEWYATHAEALSATVAELKKVVK